MPLLIATIAAAGLLALWISWSNQPEPGQLPGGLSSTRGTASSNESTLTSFSAAGEAAPAPVEAEGEGPAFQEAQRRQDIANALLRIGSELPRNSDLDLVLKKALQLVNELVQAKRGVILLAQPDRTRLVLRASLGAEEELPEGGRPSPFSRGEGLAGWVIQHRRPAVIDDLLKDPRWIRDADAQPQHRSALAVPLVIDEDTLGAMLFLSDQPGAFDEGQLPLLTAAATQVAAALYNQELFRLIRDQATQHGGMIRQKRIEASKSRAILESIAEGVLVTDANNRITLFNAAAERILQLDRSQVLGQPASDFIGLYGEAGERWIRALRRWHDRAQEGEDLRRPIDARLTLEDGRFVSLTVAPVAFEAEFQGTVTTFRDITQEVEVDRLKSEFVATVSHELRTPMTSVKGYVEMMLMEAVGEINEQQRRFLEVIKANIDRLGALVNDLLDISRIEAGRVELELEPVDVERLLQETRESFQRRSRVESKPMTIEVRAEAGLPPISADRDRLRQIVYNLVENSFNYTPADGEIQLAARQTSEGMIEIRIKDNGIGIRPSEQDRIFERFFRGEEALTQSVAGSGLGLSIVSQLVEMHGGEIELESQGTSGAGTTFFIRLPLTSSHADEVTA